MGARYAWECTRKDCNGVVAMVSGGRGYGFQVQTETRICKICKQVRDYVIGPHARLVGDSKSDRNEIVDVPACTYCGGQTESWDCSCPVCGAPMQHAEDGGVIFWD